MSMFSTRKTSELATGILLGIAVFSNLSTPAGAAELKGFTVAPNWALGSPQRPIIRGCSDVIGFACNGAFGLGPLSDVLDIVLAGRNTYTQASFSENQRLNALGRLEAGNEAIGDWWNLWIPNARWVGFGPNAGIVWFLRDRNDVGFGDAIAYVNINNAAHILWASNNSDEATATLPADFLSTLAGLGLTPMNSNTVTINNDGTFDTTNAPLPSGGSQDCTTDPACTPTGDFMALSDATPEPSTLFLLGAGLAGLAAYRRRSSLLGRRHGSMDVRP